MKSKQMFATAFTLSFLAAPVWADSGDVAAAQALFDQGKKLMASGKFAEACPKLEESLKLDAALGTVLNLADCYEKQGRLASAWSRFVAAQDMAHAGGHAEAEKVARDRASKLAPRLSHLVLEVAGADATPGLEIKRDNVVVGSAQWGTPIPADAGAHLVTAAAPGRKSWETKVELGANASTATVRVPALEAEPGSVAAAPAAAAATAAVATNEAPPPQPSTPSDSGSSGEGLGTQRTAALVAGGIGVVGVAIGTIFGFKSMSKHDDANKLCPTGSCDTQEGVTAWDDARSAGNVSTYSFIIGGVALASGAVLWLTAKPGSGATATAKVVVGARTVTLSGTW